MLEEEGAEGALRVAGLSGEVRGEAPAQRHQEPEVQLHHLRAWGESTEEGRGRRRRRRREDGRELGG